MIELLCARFGQPRVFLVGHSWGSALAMKIAAARPDLVHALVGMGQVVDMQRGETISYRFALDAARADGNAKAVRALEKIGPPPYAGSDLYVQRMWLSRYHGDLHTMTMLDYLGIALDAPEYTLGDVVGLVRGMRRSVDLLWGQLMTVNLLRECPRLEVPVFFFCGRHDQTTPSQLVVELCETIEAPTKQIIWFEGSAHMPNLEEPEAFQRALAEIALQGSRARKM